MSAATFTRLFENPQALALAEKFGVKYDGMMARYWQFTDHTKGRPTYGATFYVPMNADEQVFAAKWQEVQAKFAAAPPPPMA